MATQSAQNTQRKTSGWRFSISLCAWFLIEDLLERGRYRVGRGVGLELGVYPALGVDHKSPRLGGQAPLSHGVHDVVPARALPGLDEVRVPVHLDVNEIGASGELLPYIGEVLDQAGRR